MCPDPDEQSCRVFCCPEVHTARTAEQLAADDALTEAIRNAMAAHNMEFGVLTDYVVCVAAQRFDDDGDIRTLYGSLYQDDSMPHYRILGLLRMATMQAERGFEQADRDDE